MKKQLFLNIVVILLLYIIHFSKINDYYKDCIGILTKYFTDNIDSSLHPESPDNNIKETNPLLKSENCSETKLDLKLSTVACHDKIEAIEILLESGRCLCNGCNCSINYCSIPQQDKNNKNFSGIRKMLKDNNKRAAFK